MNIKTTVKKLNKGWKHVNYWWQVEKNGYFFAEGGSMTRRASIRRARRAARRATKQKNEEIVLEEKS